MMAGLTDCVSSLSFCAVEAIDDGLTSFRGFLADCCELVAPGRYHKHVVATGRIVEQPFETDGGPSIVGKRWG